MKKKLHFTKVQTLCFRAAMLLFVFSFSLSTFAQQLPNLSQADLFNADNWYFNEYRGGGNSDNYPHWDWSTDYMCTLDFQGTWEEQNEGTTLQINNTEDGQANPADLDNFDSFVYGNKKITVDNKILSLRIRTHAADDASPAYFGVQVVDLSATTPSAVKIGETKTYGSQDYADFTFDLSAYIGKEVVIAIGVYRKETGDYYKQLVLRAIRFASTPVTGTDWLPGTEVIQDWHLTGEMVRSTMNQTKKSFSGISSISGNRDNYVDAYKSWREISHIAKEWTLVPLHKDPEVFASEGYILKTRNDASVNTKTPESYLYAKFAIDQNDNKLTLKARNFSSTNYTYFKLTAVKEDGTVSFIAPSSNTAQEASSADDGCWKFKNEDGGTGNIDGYASFVYDLSRFNGSSVVLAFSVHKGDANTDENKLAIYSVILDAAGGTFTGNESHISDINKAYSTSKGHLTIMNEGSATIYDAYGKMYDKKMISGTSTFSIPSGIYIVRINEKAYKTIVM